MAFGFQMFSLPYYRAAVPWLAEVAPQTDKGVVLVQVLMGHLRRQGILLPAVAVLERLSAEALTRANRQLYQTVTEDLTPETGQALENLLTRREGSSLTWLAWLRQAPAAPTAGRCSNTWPASRRGKTWACRRNWRGGHIKTGCSKLPAKGDR